jgi:hypothetical protein
MAVNVLYEGLVLAESAVLKGLPAGLFLPMAGPMPVGTRLAVVAGEARREVQVSRVLEAGAEAGVFLVGARGERLTVEQLFTPTAPAEGAAAVPVELDGEADVTVPAVIELEAESDDEPPATNGAPAAAVTEAADGGDKASDADGGKRGRGRRRKKGR